MAMIKLLALLAVPAAYFGLLVFGPYYDRLDIQLTLMAILFGANTLRNGWCGSWRTLGMVLPFVLSLLLFGLLFDWLGLMGRTDWTQDSLIKAVVFPNSFLTVKLALESITFRDILSLPGHGHGKRNVILIKAVMDKCIPLLHRYRYFMEISPHFDHKRGKKILRLCAVIIALYISIYRQTENTQQLFDHRTHCLRSKK